MLETDSAIMLKRRARTTTEDMVLASRLFQILVAVDNV
jgi:hypothetical protein